MVSMRVAAAAAVASLAAAQGNWSLHLIDLTKYPMAQCLDGSPGGFYFRPGTGKNASNWIVHTQGGGWCISDQDCLGRSQGDLGSSKTWGSTPTADGGPAGMISSNPAVNPDFYDWSVAYIGYCDGGSYAGTVVAPVTVGSSTIYYRGRYILDAAYDTFLTELGMNTAAAVIVKGCSAGGLAAYIHVDYIADKITAVNPAARVVGAPGAGFFLDYPAYNGQYIYRGNYQWCFNRFNCSGSVNSGCIAAYSNPADQWRCYTAPYTLPFIKTPLFIMNSLADQWQAGNIMGLPCNPTQPGSCNASMLAYLNGFRLQMLTNLQPLFNNGRNGAFLQECLVHVVEDVDGSWNGIQVQGQKQYETFRAWFFGDASKQWTVVDGEWGSNPTCGAY